MRLQKAQPHPRANLRELLAARLGTGDVLARIQDSKIGQNVILDGPFGPKKMIYADYVASGRSLRVVEDVILEDILPYYANSHTEASFCGSYMTGLRRDARGIIARACNASDEFAVIFAGAGATAGVNRLVHLFGLGQNGQDPSKALVIIGPYEHHSNILPWRESGAKVVEIAEASTGGPDLTHLEQILRDHADIPLKIGAFSAASNVTGALSDPVAVTRILKEHGARVVWDYAGGAPYLPISMELGGGLQADAVVLSPHKFVGGPGASGVLIVRRGAVMGQRPTWPGGGTVRFAGPESHDYAQNLEAREEAGTPNVLGDIRAALVFLVKEAIGAAYIARRNEKLNVRATKALGAHDRIQLLGRGHGHRPHLPFLSFRIRASNGGYHHHQLATRMLSDLYGIQARGGCACAGPYVHRLLGIDVAASAVLRHKILAGDELAKPGFVRLNLSYLLADPEVDFILDAVGAIADDLDRFGDQYLADASHAIFRHNGARAA
ncbi:MAG: aminotransferase class V-fold PLP-dependent enzyme [Albidovulum sp.]